jgi:hypothetical protein
MDVVEQEEPVLVVDVGKEGLDPVGRHGQRTAADEGLLPAAGLPVGVAHHRVVRVPAEGQADRVVPPEQGHRPAQVGRVVDGDEVDERIPAAYVGDHVPAPGPSAIQHHQGGCMQQLGIIGEGR